MRFDGIETSKPPTLGTRPLDPLRARSCPPGQGGEQAAHKLRARGFSYRRIAEELRVRYDMVSQWLSGMPPSSRGSTPPAPVPTPAVQAEARQEESREQAAPSADGVRIAFLERRLSEVFAGLQRLSDEARQREARLQTALVEERRVATLQIERLNTDVAGLRAALAALALRPPGATLGAEAARPGAGRGFWQRREH
jgi:transcriptional regulator with XRE-family HTH domain